LALRSQSELVAGTAIVVAHPVLAALAALGGATRSLVVDGTAAPPGGQPTDVRHPQWGHGSAATFPHLAFGKYCSVHVATLGSFAGGAAAAAIGRRREPTSISPTQTEFPTFW
jgi:hypothetical protein